MIGETNDAPDVRQQRTVYKAHRTKAYDLGLMPVKPPAFAAERPARGKPGQMITGRGVEQTRFGRPMAVQAICWER